MGMIRFNKVLEEHRGRIQHQLKTLLKRREIQWGIRDGLAINSIRRNLIGNDYADDTITDFDILLVVTEYSNDNMYNGYPIKCIRNRKILSQDALTRWMSSDSSDGDVLKAVQMLIPTKIPITMIMQSIQKTANFIGSLNDLKEMIAKVSGKDEYTDFMNQTSKLPEPTLCQLPEPTSRANSLPNFQSQPFANSLLFWILIIVNCSE